MASSNIVKQIQSYTKKGVDAYMKNDFNTSLKYFLRAEKTCTGFESSDAMSTIYYNIGNSYYALNEYKRAISYYQRSLKENPDNGHAGYELSLCQFHIHDIDNACDNYFYRHYKREGFGVVKFPELPLESGLHSELDEFNGKKVLVLNEQGFGDELMFMRYIKSFADRTEKCCVQVYEELLDLFKSQIQHPKIEFFSARSITREFLDEFDIYTATGSIWAKSVKAKIPYDLTFKVDPIDLPKNSIGVVLKTNQKSKNALLRGVNEKVFVEKFNDESFNLMSLQPGFSTEIIKATQIENFVDTLTLINSMKAVVTVDTSVAHLASYTNTPTYIITNGYVDWRWTNGFYDSSIVFVKNLSELKKQLL